MNIDEQRPPQRLLALDTSTSSLAVSVMENGIMLAERNIRAERNHSVYLVTAIDEVLTAAGVSKRELHAIAVGIGPGSYTGVRIAVTTAKTMAWALRIPVYGVSSMEAIGLGGWAQESGQDPVKLAESMRMDKSNMSSCGDASEQCHWVVPLIDARRGQVYTALFTAKQGEMPTRLEDDGIRLMTGWSEELLDKLNSLHSDDKPTDIWLVGDAIAAHEQTARELLQSSGVQLHVVPYELEGRWMGLAGVRRTLSGNSDDVHSLEPNYTQLAEAEVQARAKAQVRCQ